MNHKNEKLKVILVDDVEAEHIRFKNALSALKYVQIDFLSFKSAREFEGYLAITPEHIAHIVFLDLHMPGKNGFECLKIIRRNPLHHKLIVAMHSEVSDEKVLKSCLAAGANIFITLPREFHLLKQRLHEVLRSCMQYHSMGIKFETYVRCF